MRNSVAQALATYNMSEFLLPTSICADLQRMMNGYWWGSDQRDGRGIIWQCWDGLCRRKEDLGFEIYIASTCLFLNGGCNVVSLEPVEFKIMEWKHDWCAICGAAGAAVLAGVEVSILDQGAAIGAGFVIRNNEGAVVYCGCRKIIGFFSPTLAEALCLKNVLQFMISQGLSNFLIELDAKIS
ncbi:hypothetical protein POTOM_038435 [Populus tomentosa]|uniref:RNase H type-1 domain-containing protein n=1 Tax=Populus tomentosa TaxID=118781 RepID=A0A8X7YVL1_POPTO|nr:hypothetical protein POTOM_038435 [Populus tomentosa]